VSAAGRSVSRRLAAVGTTVSAADAAALAAGTAVYPNG